MILNSMKSRNLFLDSKIKIMNSMTAFAYYRLSSLFLKALIIQKRHELFCIVFVTWALQVQDCGLYLFLVGDLC